MILFAGNRPALARGRRYLRRDFNRAWTPDFVAAMQFHKVFLQLMQYGKPEATWILKTPVYLPILDLVYATYPDAWILLTHRDPLKTIPSGLSTLASCRWHRSDVAEEHRRADAPVGRGQVRDGGHQRCGQHRRHHRGQAVEAGHGPQCLALGALIGRGRHQALQ